MTPGKYSVTEAADGANATTTGHNSGRTFDLEITEFVATDALSKAIQRLNSVVGALNPFIASSRRRSNVLQRFGSIRKGSVFSSNSESGDSSHQQDSVQPFPEIKGSGRLTSHTAILHDQHLAMAYKIDGRKIGRRDLIRNLASDLRKLHSTVRAVDLAMAEFVAGRRTSLGPEFRQKLHQLQQTLGEIRGLIEQAEEKKATMEGHFPQLDDEPVSKVLYPSGAERNANHTWHNYKAWYVKSDNVLYIEAQRRVVQSVLWVSAEIVEIMFYGHPMKYFVSPLKAGVAEHEREDEVKEDDKVILMGQYMAVVEPLDGGAQDNGQNWYPHVQGQPGPRLVPVHDQNGFRRPPAPDQNGFRHTPAPDQNGFRHTPPLQEIGISHGQGQGQVHGPEGFNQAHSQGQNGIRRLPPIQEMNGFIHGQDQGQRQRQGQGRDGFAYAQRQGVGGAGNTQGQHRSGNGHWQGNVLPMATEGMVNWLKITGVEQQAASRRGMNRRKEAIAQRSAIR